MQAPREYHSVDAARAALSARADAVRAAGLFGGIDWFADLHRHCHPDLPVRVIEARDGDAVAWLFLMMPRPRTASALTNWYSFAFAPVLTHPHDLPRRDRMFDAIARHLITRCDHVDLFPMEDAAPMLAALRRAGWFAVQRTMGARHMLDIGGRSFDDYWAQRPGALRSLIRRKGRASPYALTIEHRLTDALWQDYVDVQTRSWKAAEPPCGLALLRDMAMREGAAGTLRLGFARIDGRAVATQLWTIDGDRALIHKLGHDAAHDAGSPGTLLSHAMFRAAIDEDKVATIDYGTGDNRYKVDWMERRAPLYRIDAFNPRRASTWLPAARTAISALVG